MSEQERFDKLYMFIQAARSLLNNHGSKEQINEMLQIAGWITLCTNPYTTMNRRTFDKRFDQAVAIVRLDCDDYELNEREALMRIAYPIIP